MGYKRDSDGRWHEYFDQTKTDSCGPTSVRQVDWMIKGRVGQPMGEEQARILVEHAPGESAFGINPSTITSESGTAVLGNHDWGSHGASGSGNIGGMGAYASDLVWALKQRNHKKAREVTVDANNLRSTSLKQPGIAFVEWQAAAGIHGGAHFVTVAGALRNGKLLVLDPAFGVQEMSLTSGTNGDIEYSPGSTTGLVTNLIRTD